MKTTRPIPDLFIPFMHELLCKYLNDKNKRTGLLHSTKRLPRDYWYLFLNCNKPRTNINPRV